MAPTAGPEGVPGSSAYVELGDPRFFERAGPFSLAALAEAAEAPLDRRDVPEDRLFLGVAPLQNASPDQAAVLHNPRYAGAAETTRAGVVIVAPSLAGRIPRSSAILVSPDPHLAWAKVASLFHPVPRPLPGIHPSAVVDPEASVHASAEVGPRAVIGPRATIGAHCQIGAGAVIGAGVTMGERCRIGANASLSHALLGDRVYVYPGARIGQEGFGFAITASGFVTVPQLGRVILEDEVEIGANACVDRGASHDTVVGRGTRIDNLVQVGHNVRLGQACVMAAQSGLSGSCTVGDFVQIGAQSGFAGHLTVGSKARIGGQAGVMSDVPPGADVVGSPALPIREFFRNVAVLRQLSRRKTAAPNG